MEISDLVSGRKFREFNTTQKEELYETLLQLIVAIEEIPKKSLRRTLDVTLAVLQYKGQQVDDLQSQLKEDTHAERLIDENEKLKNMLEKLEEEKSELKQKIKELTEDIFQLQKRLQEAATAEVSDKESTDPLSELDKQEDLLRNINTKNKHIKRLLREIEALQNQNIAQSKTIIDCEAELQQCKAKILQLSADITLVDSQRKALKETVNELNIEIARLESNITYLEEEREKSERDLKSFIGKLEMKAQSWKNMLDAKDKEVLKLSAHLEKTEEPGSECLTRSENVCPTNDEGQSTKLLHALECRDKYIESLEFKIKHLAEEMMAATKLMNNLSAEKEEARNPNKPRACCKIIEESLHVANERCRQLSEMLERSEEDNALKSKQAMQAISALDAYQNGEDGLVKALRKCTVLEQKVISRDKQIRALIMELNSMHEIANENDILRKRLNIPDDMVISAKNLVAKARNKDKMIERLTLKLRASEEMRLQLKLEKSDLRKELLELQTHLQKQATANAEQDGATMDNPHSPSEVGELTDSINNANNAEINNTISFCANCKLSLDIPDEANQVVATTELKYRDVLDENDTLRAGMMEILEKLREYDAASDHITIDTEMLYRLLEALRTSSVPGTPKRLENELKGLKAREEALQALIREQTQSHDQRGIDTDELCSVESIREGGEHNGFDDLSIHLPKPLDSSTRPTTPNKVLKQNELVMETNDQLILEIGSNNLKQTLEELEIYRKGFEDLQAQLKASETELAKQCATLSAQLITTQLALKKESNSYAFMREEYDNTLSRCKENELRHINEVSSLQKCLDEAKHRLAHMEVEYERILNASNHSKEDYFQVQAVNSNLRSQLAFIIEQLFAGKLAPELHITDICADYGIINENLQLDYLTFEEYENLQKSLKETRQHQEESLRKCERLESLLEISQTQIVSQQKLLNEITDNHVNLRHLVADLQSNTEEKLLLAKMQRELHRANQELSDLRFDFDQLKQKCTTTERDTEYKQQEITEIKKNFQKERNAMDIKVRFLQKSVHTLRKKYAKFTPLIFLTNFVFAYTKFVKKTLQKAEGDRKDELIQSIKESIVASINTETASIDENLIKLIQTETKCKLLAANLNDLQNKFDSMQEELLEQRINSAKETEHWQTISALFGQSTKDSNTVNAEDVCDRAEDEDKVELVHQTPKLSTVATNTETPVPAQRKLSDCRTPVALKKKPSVELVDKNLSPIGSPIRSLTTADGITQTYEERCDKACGEENITLDVTYREKNGDEGECTSQETTVSTSVLAKTHEKVEYRSIQTETDSCIELGLQEDDTLSKKLNQKIAELQENINQRDLELKGCKNELLTCNKQIEELQGRLNLHQSSDEATSDVKANTESSTTTKNDIIEKTIISFHTLLSEKDKAISKYQDILQSEREQIKITTNQLNNDIDNLKSTITNLNFNIKTKDLEILELKTKLEVVSVRKNSAEKLDLATEAAGGGSEESGDNSLNELTDEKIEEMFEQVPTPESTGTQNIVESAAKKNKQHLEKQNEETLKDLKEKACYWEKMLTVKEEELTVLKEKVNIYEEREKSLINTVNPQLEEMKQLVEEKDKHINDLTETLNNFHEDQQRYIKDSSSYSAEQISKLHADLVRTEATNKIYHTQVEALRRQITNLTEREKQARELNQSLRNQLIKRPVVSIKTELNARVKTENLQKRIHTLELELEESRSQIQRQQIVLDAKRAKSASEVGLWEKQKRWQQNAEKFKAKYEETEAALEKTRGLLQSARSMIARLEKEKQTLEIRLGRSGQCGALTMKCCRMPSCPNLQHRGNKYTTSESPETYTGASSECSSPAHSAIDHHKHLQQTSQLYTRDGRNGVSEKDQHNIQLIEALKSRIELQQRKILAIELSGKGSNALTTELEKLQEKLSEIEAQNIRLEAKNLQLQLDNDLLRQGDATERMEKRIKYLEDYIIALKEEMAQAEARRELCKCSGIKINTQLGQSAEQTILSLRGIVEKLRAENKFLKDARRSCESRNMNELNNVDFNKLKKLYSESLDKVSSLQMELNMRAKCQNCTKADTPVRDEMSFIKEQLSKKTQLLQKAKVLLTRAAAKEKVLKEQLLMWKLKCSELQNVPVIDEISE